MKAGAVVAVPIQTFRHDFQVLLSDYGAVGTTAIVRILPYNHFKSWAHKQRPDWDRYLPNSADFLFKSGKLTAHECSECYTSKVFTKIKNLLDQDPYDLGFKLYIESMAYSIAKPNTDVAPLVTQLGKPIDGRHRTLAAELLERKVVPILEISEIY